MARKLLVLIGLMALGCQQEDITKDTPECIKNIIGQIENEAVWNPPAAVFRYVYKGRTVYYVPPRCCDIPSILFDENCQTVCSPEGGLTGHGDGKCQDFFTSRKNEELIWKDPRKQ